VCLGIRNAPAEDKGVVYQRGLETSDSSQHSSSSRRRPSSFSQVGQSPTRNMVACFEGEHFLWIKTYFGFTMLKYYTLSGGTGVADYFGGGWGEV